MPLSPPAQPHTISPELRYVHSLHTKIAQLRTREALITERIKRYRREREEVRGALGETKAELETAVQAPAAGGVDPTAWLPDELLCMILVRVLAGGTCGRVCRRWHAVCVGATAKKEAWEWRWAGYNHGRVGGLTPRTLMGWSASAVTSLATSLNDRIYVGKQDGVIQVRYTLTNTNTQHLHTLNLHGHTGCVRALVVGKDGTVYSASDDHDVRIWCADDGSHIHTIEGHDEPVYCLALGADGTLYTGSADTTIRVWARGGWGGARLVRTLEGHGGSVFALALSRDGKLYSGSLDNTIRVWSTVDGSHIRTLEGHTGGVLAVAVGADGTVYSGSRDDTRRMWSGQDGSPIRTLQMHWSVQTIVIGAGNTVFIGDNQGTISIWNGGAGPACELCTFTSPVTTVVIGQDGRLFFAGSDTSNVLEL
jgi:WD40 repeat protein